MISQEHTHNYLKDMKIRGCPQFESFPNEGLSAPLLMKCTIKGLENLKIFPKRMHILLPSLTELVIHDCPQVEMLPDGGLPLNIESMDLSNCSKLIASLKGAKGANTCLETMFIEEEDVESFPNEGFLSLSLTSLYIHNCSNLKRLDYKGICHLPSLEKFKLWDCPILQCLPDEGLPKSVSTLQISNCPLVEQRCHKPDGEDWGRLHTYKTCRLTK